MLVLQFTGAATSGKTSRDFAEGKALVRSVGFLFRCNVEVKESITALR
jgi:hypothetical protein